FLHEPAAQRAFVLQGFRPAENVQFDDVINPRNGVDATKPTAILNPDRIDAAAGKAIVSSWGTVKKPGVATFVVDTSGSMAGGKLEQAKQGLLRALDSIDKGNNVGFLTFSDDVNTRIPVGPYPQTRYAIADAVDAMRAAGQTALYEAIRDAIAMTDG